MMISGTKAKKHLTTLFLLLSIGLSHTYAQSDEVLAKSYFLKAQEAYSEGNNTTAIENLDKTLEYLSSTNAKIEALYVKIAINKENYIAADNHLNTYFEVSDESHSDYMEMLGYVAEMKEKSKKMLKDLRFVDGIAKVELNSGYGFINKTGKEVIQTKYFNVHDFSEGLAAVRLNFKWGFINKEGNLVIPPEYGRVESFSEGLAKVRIEFNSKIGYIDKTGKMVIPPKYKFAESFSEGLAKVKVNFDDKWGFIDKTGKMVIPPIYQFAESFSEGLANVSLNYNSGFIDKTGEVVIPLKYGSYGTKPFSEGLARVELGSKLGFIDKTGKVVIPIKYSQIYGKYGNGEEEYFFFTDGRVKVKLDGEEFYIDKNGNRIEE